MFSRKDLARLILPLIVEQFLAATIGIADTLMVSSVGEAAVSGVSLVDSINILLIQVFAALATGGAIVSAQYLGREDKDNANHAAKQLLLITGVLSLGIMTICLVGKAPILHALFGAAESAVLENASVYFLVSALSYPFIAIYNSGAALFRSMGNSRISMIASIMMNAVNISGNALLIYGFHMGAAGAGIASLVSRMAGAIMMVTLLRNPRNIIHLSDLTHWDYQPAMVKNILRVGIPTGLENGMFHIGKILVAGLIATFGTVAITANAVSNNIASLSQIPGSAIGLAMVTVVGQCVGARNYKEAQSYAIKLTALAYLLMGVLNLWLLFNLRAVIGLYGNLSVETTNTAVQIMTYHCYCCMTLWPAAFCLPNGLRAANDVRFTMTTSIFSMWVFRIGFSYIIGKFMGVGVLGVWIAMFIDWLFRGTMFVIRLLGGKWKEKQLL